MRYILWIILAVAAYGTMRHRQDEQAAKQYPTLNGSHQAPDDGRDWALVKAIEWVESRGNPEAVGDKGQAVGCLQIHPALVEEVNRILGRKEYTVQDRSNPAKSYEMFWVYADKYSYGESRQVIARRWNGGPDGDSERATTGFWDRVRSRLHTQK